MRICVVYQMGVNYEMGWNRARRLSHATRSRASISMRYQYVMAFFYNLWNYVVTAASAVVVSLLNT